jgi:histone-lysine N-methyltransferase SETD2
MTVSDNESIIESEDNEPTHGPVNSDHKSAPNEKKIVDCSENTKSLALSVNAQHEEPEEGGSVEDSVLDLFSKDELEPRESSSVNREASTSSSMQESDREDSEESEPRISKPQSMSKSSFTQRKRTGSPKDPIQVIGDLPVAREAAMKSFVELEENYYQNKSIGKNQEMMESMTCECIMRKGSFRPRTLLVPLTFLLHRGRHK